MKRKILDSSQANTNTKPSKEDGVKLITQILKPCHEEPKEVYPGLFVGSWRCADEMARKGVDVLVPLAELDGGIWDTGFRGKILYYPCKDYHALPDDILTRLVGEILEALEGGHKVGIFCMGGHGRTGYVAAAVLGKLLPSEDPIAYLRRVYCHKAVESREQIEALIRFLGREDLRANAPVDRGFSWAWEVSTACQDCFYAVPKGKEVECSLDPGREAQRKGQGCSLAISRAVAEGLDVICHDCTYYLEKGGKCSVYGVKGNVVDCDLYYPQHYDYLLD